ncbi:hypothetical protein ACFW1A_16415 [Kitasatospora sp. NPDC058965]|uniref:hypothetical protein n=1 Tax=Kitasatospora sp. NPDC058965 TaxID=3346682 RepID=UPI0036AA1C7C
MTAPGPVRPSPGSAAIAGRPVAASLVLPLFGLLVALLVLLPSAGTAHAAAPGPAPTTAPAATAEHRDHADRQSARHAAPAAPAPAAPSIWCASETPDQVPGHGCSSHSFCGQDAQLPNAPPQPGTADPPLLVAPAAVPAPAPVAAARRPAPAPDLHLLQVNRP